MQSVLMIGLGKSGQAVVQFCLQKNIVIHGVDDKIELFQEHSILAPLIAQGAVLHHASVPVAMETFDLVVTSPGIPNSHPLIQKALQRGVKVIGEIEFACHFLSHRRLLGITGTNGKTTVTLLVAHILNSCGIAAKAVGNVGAALIAEAADDRKDDEAILVVELSSYQLETLALPILEAAVILNITPDHLDRYASLEAYAAAKMQIAVCLKPGGELYLDQQTMDDYSFLLPSGSIDVRTYGFSRACYLHVQHDQLIMDGKAMMDLPLLYRGRESHDVQNLLAAYALCYKIGVMSEQFLLGLATFSKPPHRIEFVREKDGVKFFDDSKGTNIDAVIKAVGALRAESASAKIFLIAGGVDKGFGYDSWLEAFHGSVRAIYAIGQAAGKIEKELSHAIPVQFCTGLEQAVREAAASAQPGDYVLLSPGCASWDMFRDYAHRGEEFQTIVKQL